jgi:GntR family transcriptional repressor for pyruvate dehydrogenase complex
MSEEVTEMYATVDDPIEYLIHDVRFHRVIAQASGNPILAALMETITSALYDERRKTAERSRDLKESADLHREIFRAIRSRNAAEARSVMERHLTMAQSAQDLENSGAPAPTDNGRPPKKGRRKAVEV